MTSREQFEAEMAKLGDIVDMRRAKNGDMEYMAWDVSLAWRMWQASREAVEVELPTAEPDRGSDSQVDISAGFSNRMRSKCIESIRAAGIKVKGE